ncbi:MAG: hypothetical protein AAF389_18540 [Gemmatimonadota bacterium]
MDGRVVDPGPLGEDDVDALQEQPQHEKSGDTQIAPQEEERSAKRVGDEDVTRPQDVGVRDTDQQQQTHAHAEVATERWVIRATRGQQEHARAEQHAEDRQEALIEEEVLVQPGGRAREVRLVHAGHRVSGVPRDVRNEHPENRDTP